MYKYFASWDWEHDIGKGELSSNEDLPGNHVKALYNYQGLVYRVIKTNAQKDIIYYYDYFYDDTGNIVEKRSLDNTGDIGIIVRYEYKNGKKIAEIGWDPIRSKDPRRIII
jgi:hypothetical protein